MYNKEISALYRRTRIANNSYRKSIMASPIVHVFTDFGVKDTDDALLMTYLSQLSAACHHTPLNITFVFTGADGITAADAISSWVREYEHIIIKDMTACVSFEVS